MKEEENMGKGKQIHGFTFSDRRDENRTEDREQTAEKSN